MAQLSDAVKSTGTYYVKLTLGCSSTKFEHASGNKLKICVKADDASEANAEVKAFIGKELHIWDSKVQITSGMSAKEKTLYISL